MLRSPLSPMSRHRVLVLLVACLTFSSIPVLHKYAGLAGVAAYVLITACVVGWWSRSAAIAKVQSLSPLASAAIIGGLLVAMLLLFLFVYPQVNSSLPGQGSDRDDALNMAVRALLRGEHPYRELTYLGNPVTPLPGALLLATPFVLLGNSAYQNLFWLAAFVCTVGSGPRKPGHAPWLMGLLLLSPALWQDFLTGGDLLANSLYVCVASAWMIRSVSSREINRLATIGAAVLLGLALTSRPHFFVLIPLVFAVIARQRGLSLATLNIAVSVATMALLTVPLYLADPAAFSPLHVARKLQQLDGVLPHAEYWLPAISVLFASVVAFRADTGNFMWRAALVLAVPVLGAVVLDSIGSGHISLTLMAHGLNFMVFALIASSQVLLFGAPGADPVLSPPAS